MQLLLHFHNAPPRKDVFQIDLNSYPFCLHVMHLGQFHTIVRFTHAKTSRWLLRSIYLATYIFKKTLLCNPLFRIEQLRLILLSDRSSTVQDIFRLLFRSPTSLWHSSQWHLSVDVSVTQFVKIMRNMMHQFVGTDCFL